MDERELWVRFLSNAERAFSNQTYPAMEFYQYFFLVKLEIIKLLNTTPYSIAAEINILQFYYYFILKES
jgi:hypothetical protein